MSRGGEPIGDVQPGMGLGGEPGSQNPGAGVRPGAWMLEMPGLRAQLDPQSLVFQPVGDVVMPEPKVPYGDYPPLERRYRTALAASATLRWEMERRARGVREPSDVDPTEPIVVTNPLPALRDLLIRDGFVGTTPDSGETMVYRSQTEEEALKRREDAELRESLPALHAARIAEVAEAIARQEAIIDTALVERYFPQDGRHPDHLLYELPALMTVRERESLLARHQAAAIVPRPRKSSEQAPIDEALVGLVRNRIIVIKPGAPDEDMLERYLTTVTTSMPVATTKGEPTGETTNTKEYLRTRVAGSHLPPNADGSRHDDVIVYYERDRVVQQWELIEDSTTKEPLAKELPLPGGSDRRTFNEAVIRQLTDQSEATDPETEIDTKDVDTVPKGWSARGPAYVRAMRVASRIPELRAA